MLPFFSFRIITVVARHGESKIDKVDLLRGTADDQRVKQGRRAHGKSARKLYISVQIEMERANCKSRLIISCSGSTEDS